MTYIQKIQFLMEERHWSQNRLAKEAQVSQSGLSTIMDGSSSPKLNTLESLAKALNCTVIDLLTDDYSATETSFVFNEIDNQQAHYLTPEEARLVLSFRDLSQQGKDAVLASVDGALIHFKKTSQSDSSSKKIG